MGFTVTDSTRSAKICTQVVSLAGRLVAYVWLSLAASRRLPVARPGRQPAATVSANSLAVIGLENMG